MENNSVIQTVLGPVPADELGVVLPHEQLLSIVPGAEFAPEIVIDQQQQYEVLKGVLTEYKRLGGQTIVDNGGMFKGRNVQLYQTLSKETGVHIVASTGLGPGTMVGSYFTTQQTDPPGPMPLDRLAEMYANEITEGTVVPRRGRTGPAGIICTAANEEGITAFEEHLYRGAAQAALQTGAPVSIKYGKDVSHELDLLEKEGLDLGRVIVGGLDRLEADEAKTAFDTAKRGAIVALDHVGWTPHEGYISDKRRADLVAELIEAGHGDRILISSNAAAYALGHMPVRTSFRYVFDTFVPLLRETGITDEQLSKIMKENPQRVLVLQQQAVGIGTANTQEKE